MSLKTKVSISGMCKAEEACCIKHDAFFFEEEETNSKLPWTHGIVFDVCPCV